MIEVMEYIGLILWVIYLFLFVNREIGRKNKYAEEYTKELIIKKPFHIIRIDSLFFLIVYLIYNDFADNRVLPYLYILIVLTNIVYVVYDLIDNYKSPKIELKKELIYYSGAVFLILVTFTYMVITKNLFNTCTLTLILNIIVPIYIWLIKILKKNKEI